MPPGISLTGPPLGLPRARHILPAWVSGKSCFGRGRRGRCWSGFSPAVVGSLDTCSGRSIDGFDLSEDEFVGVDEEEEDILKALCMPCWAMEDVVVDAWRTRTSGGSGARRCRTRSRILLTEAFQFRKDRMSPGP